MILVDAGEIGVHVGDRVHILRPSLYAISSLGTPAAIVEMFATIMSDPASPKWQFEQFLDALAVVHACASEDLTDVFGFLNDRYKYVVRHAEPSDILVLARHLLLNGIVGDVKPEGRETENRDSYVKEFHAREYVAMGMAHLGLTEQEAWNMTMTALVMALRSKFPMPQKQEAGSNAPTVEEHDATMEWFEQIDKQRKAGKA